MIKNSANKEQKIVEQGKRFSLAALQVPLSRNKRSDVEKASDLESPEQGAGLFIPRLSSKNIEKIEEILNSGVERSAAIIPDGMFRIYARNGDANVEKILNSRFQSVIEIIPADVLRHYASANDANVEKILNSRIDSVIKEIADGVLRNYASGSDANVEKILNSRSEKAMALIPVEVLKIYASGSDANVEKILNSRSEKMIRVIPLHVLRNYASGSNSNIDKILSYRHNKLIALIPVGRLKAYASRGDINLEKVLSSRSEKAIAMIPPDVLKNYVTDSDANLEKILSSQLDKVIELVPAYRITEYADKSDSNLERILRSKSATAINWVSIDKLTHYANQDESNIEIILSSGSNKAIGLIPNEELIAYADKGDSYIETILASKSEAIGFIPMDKLKDYASRGDANIEKILRSNSEIAIAGIPANLLRVYASSGDVNIEKILNSRSEIAINLIPDKKLKSYAGETNSNVEKILSSASTRAIGLIPHDHLSFYADVMRRRFGKIVSLLERQESAISFDIPDLSDEDTAKIEELLGSVEITNLFPLDKLVAYAEGGNSYIEKILSARSDKMIDLIPVNQLATYARKGNKYIENILDSRCMRAINLISIVQLRSYIQTGEEDRIEKILNSRSEGTIGLIPDAQIVAYARQSDDHIEKILDSRSYKAINLIAEQLKGYARKNAFNLEKILNSHSDEAINFIANQLEVYANGGDTHIEKILSSGSDKAIAMIPAESLKAYARQSYAHLEKILASKYEEAISLVPGQLKAYVSQGGNVPIEKVLNSRSHVAIDTIPTIWLIAYARGGDIHIGKILSSRSERAIGMIPLRMLKLYADGSDTNIEEILNSQSSKAIRLIPIGKLKAYLKQGDGNIGKVLDSRSNIAIATIPSNWLVTYAKGGDANLEKILSSRSEVAMDLIPEKKLIVYARQGEVSVGKIINSGSDRLIKLIPYDSLSNYAQTMHQHFEKIGPYLDDLNRAISRVRSETCLYKALGPSKREALRKDCEIAWDDVDEFNEEKATPRDFKKIIINSEQFLSYIQTVSHSENKRIQLLQLASEVSVIGGAKERVRRLIRHQNTLLYLNKINRISSRTMSGMMTKNVLADFLQEDYEDVVVNLGFIAGGNLLHKVAEVAAVEGEKLFAGGQRFLGRSLKLASPFTARGTSALIVYDLVNQIKAYAQDNPDALAGMVGDGIYLGIEGAEIGIEIAEIAGVLEGVSTFTGPIGAGIGTLVFIGTDVYLAAKRIEREDALINLTSKEKWMEGLRAFIGMAPQADLETLLEEKQENNQLYLQGIAFLKKHTDIQRYVFKLPVLKEECNTSLIRKCRMQLFGYAVDCYRREPVVDTKCVATQRWEKEVSSVVILDEKRKNIMLLRSKPDAPEGALFCPPVAPLYSDNVEAVLSHDNYLCDNAIGVEYSDLRKGNTTFISLGDGDDTVVGFPYGNHIVLLGDGYKSINLGGGDDTILVNGNKVTGSLIGGGGLNTLDLGSFAGQEIVRMDAYPIKYTDKFNQSSYISDHFIIETKLTGTSSLQTHQFQRFLFRANKRDEVLLPGCHLHFIDTRGGAGKRGEEDFISINRDRTGNNCISDLTLVVRPYTVIYNFDINESSIYTYLVPLQGGSATVSIFSNCAFNRFVFEAKLSQLDNFNWNNRSSTITFSFLKSKEPLTKFNFLIDVQKSPICSNDRKRLFFQLGDSTEIRMLEDKFYVFEKTNSSVKDIIRDYSKIANRVNFSIFVHTSLTNESIAVGNEQYDVLHNDPYRRSHLIGNGGENIFVVSAGDRVLDPMQLPLPEVVLYDIDDKNLIDMLDLRQIKKQLEKNLGLEVKARVRLVSDTSDISIELFSSAQPNDNFIAVRLNDALITNWHRRLHIILNHVPLKLDALKLKPLSLKFSPQQQNIIIISPEDIEENTRLIISKRIGVYRFTRWGENDLMMTNAFDQNVLETQRYTLLFRQFYQDDVFESLVLEFVDKKLVLENEIEHIEYAANFALEHEFYNRTLYAMLFNKNVTVLPVSRVQVRRSHPEIQDEMTEKKGEANESIWIRMTSYALPMIGVGIAMVGIVGYRNKLRARSGTADVMSTLSQGTATLPLLPQAKADTAKKPTLEYLHKKHTQSESFQELSLNIANKAVAQTVLLKWLFYYLGGHMIVERMNQVESISSYTTNETTLTALDLVEKQVKKAIENFPSKVLCWTGKGNTSKFFQSAFVPSSILNDSQIDVPQIKYQRISN